MKQKNKAQMEIMGLAIIIILISLGVLFALQFVLREEQNSFEQGYRESELASNMLSVMGDVTTGCYGTTLATLLRDCAVTATIKCPGTIDSLSIVDSCKYARWVIERILSGTLDSWNRNYHLIAEMPAGDEPCPANAGKGSKAIINYGTKCPGAAECGKSWIQTKRGTLMLWLELCQ